MTSLIGRVAGKVRGGRGQIVDILLDNTRGLYIKSRCFFYYNPQHDFKYNPRVLTDRLIVCEVNSSEGPSGRVLVRFRSFNNSTRWLEFITRF